MGDLLVDALREQQGDVDRDPLRRELADRRKPGGSGRHLDHQVVAADRLVEAARLLQRLLGVEGEIGRYFEAHIAVGAVAGLVDRPEHIGRVLDVLNGEPLVEVDDAGIALAEHGLEAVIVLGGVADGLLEDRRVGGYAAQIVILDQGLEFALGDEAAGDEIEPDRLLMLGEEGLQRVHLGRPRVNFLSVPHL